MTPDSIPPSETAEGLAQIRDILFGQQARHFESRLADLQSLSTQMQAGFEARAQALRSQIDQLQAQMAHEQAQIRQEQAAAVDALTQRLEELSRTVAEQGDYVRRTMTGRHELARLLHEVAAKLSDSIQDHPEVGR